MKKRILSLLPLALVLAAVLCTPALALTEAEVEAQVAASSKAAVTGNVLIWFLCALAFLKVSQKIDSFMASMGVNVGRTGGSLLGEAMIAVRGASMIAKAGGGAIGGLGRSGSSGSGQTTSGSADSAGGFFKGGLIGMASRHFNNNSASTTASQASAVHTAQSQSTSSAARSASSAHTANSVHSGGTHTASSVQSGGVGGDPGIIQTDSTIQSATIQSDSSAVASQEHTSSEAQSDAAVFADAMSQQEGIITTGFEAQSAVQSESTSQVLQSGGSAAETSPTGTQISPPDSITQPVHTAGPGEHTHTQSGTAQVNHTSTNTQTILPNGIGGAALCRSLAGDGKFANEVIGTVARGETQSPSRITGDMAAFSLSSYMGISSQDRFSLNSPHYSDVEIGGGRISGTEFLPGDLLLEHGTAFQMYHAGQFEAPQGPHEQIRTADGALWYKQTAQDAAGHTPNAVQGGAVADPAAHKPPASPKHKGQK